MRFRVVLILVLSTAISCTNSSFAPFVDPISPPDQAASELPSAEMTEITVTDGNVADGITPAQVSLRIRSANGNPIEGVTMSLWASGSDNVLVPCTASDSLGQSRCLLYTTKAEVKNLKLSGPISLASWVAFAAPKPLRSNFSFVSSAMDMKLPSGRRVISTSGIVEGPFVKKDSQGVIRLRSSVLSSVIND
jgi:hypothetical protein